MRGGAPPSTADRAASVLSKAPTFGLRSKELCLDEGECLEEGLSYRWTQCTAPLSVDLSPRTQQSLGVCGGCPAFVRLSARALRYRRTDLRHWVEARIRFSTSDCGDVP